jgi:hypothetical protein
MALVSIIQTPYKTVPSPGNPPHLNDSKTRFSYFLTSPKSNCSHLFPARQAYILPCLGRFETDEQATGNQTVTTEDSFSMINGSIGEREPASAMLKSELAIVADLAKAMVTPSEKLKWDTWTGVILFYEM